MHELALKAFEEAGFRAPADFTGSATIATPGGIVDVEYHALYPEWGTLVLPVNPIEREKVMRYVFPESE